MTTEEDRERIERWERQQAAHNRALQEVASYVRDLVGDSATLTVTPCEVSPDLRVVPHNPRSAPVSVTAFGELVVQVGRGEGGLWELELDDVETAQRLIAAAYAGRVVERFALARSKVIVTFEDGEVWRETGLGCLSVLLPLPYWKRVHYEPYE